MNEYQEKALYRLNAVDGAEPVYEIGMTPDGNLLVQDEDGWYYLIDTDGEVYAAIWTKDAYRKGM